MILALIATAAAQYVTVCETSCDFDRIQDAIDAVDGFGRVAIGPGIYAESLVIEAKSNLFVTGPEGYSSAVIIGDGQSASVITIRDSTGINLAQLSVSSVASRALEVVDADAAISGCYLAARGFSAQGGAVRISEGVLRASGTIFDGGNAADGGVIWAESSTVELTVADIQGGSALNRGGGIYATDSVIIVQDSIIADNVAATLGGGVFLGGASTFDSLEVHFDHNRAMAGGAIASRGRDSLAHHVAASTFVANRAGSGSGGGISAGGGSWYVTGSLLEDNVAAGSGGGINASTGGTVAILGSTFCGNRANAGGAVAVDRMGGDSAWTGNHFVENSADAEGGAISVWSRGLALSGNSFLGNGAPYGGAMLVSQSLELSDNIFAWNASSGAADFDRSGHTIAVIAAAGPTVSASRNLTWNNMAPEGDWPATAEVSGTVVADPQLTQLSLDGSCRVQHVDPIGTEGGAFAFVEDIPGPYSPARDAGDPGVPDQAGTPNDIGAWGAYSVNQPFWADVDGDGAPALYDCDDNDATVLPGDAPGSSEIWYNGIDNDCDGANDFDRDQDGHDVAGHAGGSDCDDLDATVYVGAAEIPQDGIDQDCLLGDLVDLDNDGYAPAPFNRGDPADCDDADPLTHPDALEDIGPEDRDCTGYHEAPLGLVGAGCRTAPVGGSLLGCIWVVVLAGFRPWRSWASGTVPDGSI